MIDGFVLAIASPAVLLVALLVYLVGRWLRIMPAGAGAAPMLLLLACAGAAGRDLYGFVDATVTRPAAVQARYLGRPYVGVLSLRSYRADIGSEWRYALPPATLAQLRARCVAQGRKPAGRYCDLFLRQEGRTYTHLWIEDGQLHMVDG